MITTHKQAMAVQTRRVAAGKRGFAKAVRRFWNSHSKTIRRTGGEQHGFPVIWSKPAKTA